jgi:hypothetical protein
MCLKNFLAYGGGGVHVFKRVPALKGIRPFPFHIFFCVRSLMGVERLLTVGQRCSVTQNLMLPLCPTPIDQIRSDQIRSDAVVGVVSVWCVREFGLRWTTGQTAGTRSNRPDRIFFI